MAFLRLKPRRQNLHVRDAFWALERLDSVELPWPKAIAVCRNLDRLAPRARAIVRIERKLAAKHRLDRYVDLDQAALAAIPAYQAFLVEYAAVLRARSRVPRLERVRIAAGEVGQLGIPPQQVRAASVLGAIILN